MTSKSVFIEISNDQKFGFVKMVFKCMIVNIDFIIVYLI